MNKQRTGYGLLVLTVVVSLLAVIPQPAIAQSDKGIELYNSGQFRDAEKVFREALRIKPQDVTANYYLGLSVLLQNKPQEALEIFLKLENTQAGANKLAKSAVPSEYQIQIALARARLALKQYEEAWENLEAAGKGHSNSSEVCMYRGVYYLRKEMNSEAVAELEKAIALDAKNAYAYFYAGIAHDREGHAERAVQVLKIFLELVPDAPEANLAKSIIDRLC